MVIIYHCPDIADGNSEGVLVSALSNRGSNKRSDSKYHLISTLANQFLLYLHSVKSKQLAYSTHDITVRPD